MTYIVVKQKFIMLCKMHLGLTEWDAKSKHKKEEIQIPKAKPKPNQHAFAFLFLFLFVWPNDSIQPLAMLQLLCAFLGARVGSP